jgi:hypothetical protein
MTSKKLGALLRSVPPATARGELPELPQERAASVQIPEVETAPTSARFSIEAEVPLQVLIPKHIRTQLGVMAANEGKSLRAVVLTAIRELGISVTDEEMRDKRGRRRRRS